MSTTIRNKLVNIGTPYIPYISMYSKRLFRGILALALCAERWTVLVPQTHNDHPNNRLLVSFPLTIMPSTFKLFRALGTGQVKVTLERVADAGGGSAVQSRSIDACPPSVGLCHSCHCGNCVIVIFWVLHSVRNALVITLGQQGGIHLGSTMRDHGSPTR
jgi:hypothetical protein